MAAGARNRTDPAPSHPVPKIHNRPGTARCSTRNDSHGPLCRRYRRAKQAVGWWPGQPEPGVLDWHLPHGYSYTVTPEPCPI
jgi:hypothetical protein